MSDVQSLLEHRQEALTAVLLADLPAGLGPVLYRYLVDALRPERLDAEAKRLDAEERRLEGFRQANHERTERSAERMAGIHRAADKFLTTAAMRLTSRRERARKLWQWLWLPERCRLYGLESRPSLRTIRRSLATWTPPCGKAISRASNGSSST